MSKKITNAPAAEKTLATPATPEVAAEETATAPEQTEAVETKPAQKPKSKSGMAVAEVEPGVFMEFTTPSFRLEGKTYTHEEAAENTNIIQKLHEIGFGGWQQVF